MFTVIVHNLITTGHKPTLAAAWRCAAGGGAGVGGAEGIVGNKSYTPKISWPEIAHEVVAGSWAHSSCDYPKLKGRSDYVVAVVRPCVGGLISPGVSTVTCNATCKRM